MENTNEIVTSRFDDRYIVSEFAPNTTNVNTGDNTQTENEMLSD